MINDRYIMGIILAAIVTVLGVGIAEGLTPVSGATITKDLSQAIVQIGGRFCEYLRPDIESALRRFQTVRQVEFLNDHGTVLVHYEPDSVSPSQLAVSVEEALRSGIGCRAWVDRGAKGSGGS